MQVATGTSVDVPAAAGGRRLREGGHVPAARRRPAHRETVTALLFLLPSLVGLLLFLVLPLCASLALSFTNWQLLGKARFVGWANYVRLLTQDPNFPSILRNTLVFTVEYVALNIVISLGMAAWISSLRVGRQVLRLIFFLPTFTPLIGVSIVWLLMFTPGGLVDFLLQALHLPIPNLLSDPGWAMQAVVIVSLWAGFGYNLLLFGAALDSIPQPCLEAARLDGAGPWRRFFAIRLPLISPTIFFGTVMTTITALQVFDQVFALTRGGPGSATQTLGFAIYQYGFGSYRMGYASAVSWVMFLIIGLLTLAQFRLQRRWVHYGQ